MDKLAVVCSSVTNASKPPLFAACDPVTVTCRSFELVSPAKYVFWLTSRAHSYPG